MAFQAVKARHERGPLLRQGRPNQAIVWPRSTRGLGIFAGLESHEVVHGLEFFTKASLPEKVFRKRNVCKGHIERNVCSLQKLQSRVFWHLFGIDQILDGPSQAFIHAKSLPLIEYIGNFLDILLLESIHHLFEKGPGP